MKIIVPILFLLLSTNASADQDVGTEVSKPSVAKSSTVMSENSLTDSALSNPMSSSYLIQLILGLAVVILCVVALAWFAKKMNKFNASTDDSLKIISGLSMGTREKIVLLQVGEEQLLVGVSPGNISKLHSLKTPIVETNTSAGDKGFANKFKKIMDDANASSVVSSNNKNNK